MMYIQLKVAITTLQGSVMSPPNTDSRDSSALPYFPLLQSLKWRVRRIKRSKRFRVLHKRRFARTITLPINNAR